MAAITNDYLFDGFSNLTFEGLEGVEEQVENVLNKFGYIPFVSSLSASVRGVFSVAQMVSGVAFAIIYAISAHVNEDVSYQEKSIRWLSQAANGVGNLVRANIEAVPILGNIAAAIYDLGVGFRVAYKSEQPQYNFLNVFYFKTAA